MNRTIRTFAAIAVVSLAFQVRVTAGPKGVAPAKAKVTKPAAHAVTAARSAKTAAPATMKPSKPTAKADVKAAKTTAKSAKVVARADAKPAKSATRANGSADEPHSFTTPTPPFAVVSNPVADKISRKPNLAAKVASRLPPGMTLAQASTGFRNQGQFLAAVNVSKNLGIDFVKLQTAMTGQTVSVDPKTHAITTTPTGDAPLSLGRSIQMLRPGSDAGAAVQKAQAQTSKMVQ